MDSGGEKGSKRSKVIWFLVLFVVATLFIIFLLYISKSLTSSNTQRQQFFDIELEEMVARVGEAYLLPDEIPTMHTVSDKSQLSNNLFYQKAENGDKVLVFKTADLAIIFRPSISKIINIDKASSLEVYDNLSNKLEQVGIIVMNGTEVTGLARRYSEEISEVDFVNILELKDAENKPYEESIVVYLNQQFEEQAEIIGASISASVINSLPIEETAEGADVVVILGDNYSTNE